MPTAVSNTPYGIIRDALTDAGYLDAGDDPDSEQLANGMRRLCDIINLYQTGGIKLFLLQEISVDLVAGTSSYTLNPTVGTFPAKHLRVEHARIQTPQGERRPLTPISWSDWNSLPQTTTGAITGYFEDRQATSLVIKVWNTPDATEAANTLVATVRTQAANPFNLETDVSFPQEWRIALRWGLADDLATGQPAEIMARCKERADLYRQQLEDWDVEAAETRFAPDMRYHEGGFL